VLRMRSIVCDMSALGVIGSPGQKRRLSPEIPHWMEIGFWQP
jgi:hypothetical protein